jgi:hypothetical protein
MTLFEYISVAVSIIIALAIAEGLRGLRSALNSDRRYGIHTAWIFIKLANPIFYWWSIWRFRDFPEVWNMGTFTLVLIMPSIMYLQLHSLVSNNPEKIDDWRGHFYDQRRWFFGLNVLLAACAVIVFTYPYLNAPPQSVPIIAYTLIGVLSIVGFMSDNARLHAAIAITVAVFSFCYWWVISFRPPVLT